MTSDGQSHVQLLLDYMDCRLDTRDSTTAGTQHGGVEPLFARQLSSSAPPHGRDCPLRHDVAIAQRYVAAQLTSTA